MTESTSRPQKRPSRSSGESLSESVIEVVQGALAESGINASLAEPLSVAVVDAVFDLLAGQNIYFPFRSDAKKARRNAEILAEFNGVNHYDLAKKHKLSVQRIYKILKTRPASPSTSNKVQHA